MKVDKETLERIAHLSRLYLKKEEEETLLQNMNNIVDWMEKLNELDTEGVEPLYHITETTNNLREDEVKDELPREKAFFNAPKHDDTFFRVPKVVG